MLAETLDTLPNRTLSVAPARDGRPGHDDPVAVRTPYSGPRWYCVQSHPREEERARDALVVRRFDVFLPMVEARTRRAPGGPLAISPMFPGYLFVSFDRGADKWQRACSAQGVKRLFCSTPDYPVPIQRGIVESLIGKTREGIVRLDPIPDFLQAGATVRLIGTPFMDQTGVCLWVKGDRVKLALTMFGRVLNPVVSRSMVEPA